MYPNTNNINSTNKETPKSYWDFLKIPDNKNSSSSSSKTSTQSSTTFNDIPKKSDDKRRNHNFNNTNFNTQNWDFQSQSTTGNNPADFSNLQPPYQPRVIGATGKSGNLYETTFILEADKQYFAKHENDRWVSHRNFGQQNKNISFTHEGAAEFRPPEDPPAGFIQTFPQPGGGYKTSFTLENDEQRFYKNEKGAWASFLNKTGENKVYSFPHTTQDPEFAYRSNPPAGFSQKFNGPGDSYTTYFTLEPNEQRFGKDEKGQGILYHNETGQNKVYSHIHESKKHGLTSTLPTGFSQTFQRSDGFYQTNFALPPGEERFGTHHETGQWISYCNKSKENQLHPYIHRDSQHDLQSTLPTGYIQTFFRNDKKSYQTNFALPPGEQRFVKKPDGNWALYQNNTKENKKCVHIHTSQRPEFSASSHPPAGFSHTFQRQDKRYQTNFALPPGEQRFCRKTNGKWTYYRNDEKHNQLRVHIHSNEKHEHDIFPTPPKGYIQTFLEQGDRYITHFTLLPAEKRFGKDIDGKWIFYQNDKESNELKSHGHVGKKHDLNPIPPWVKALSLEEKDAFNPEAVKKAYKRQALKNHPDKTSKLPPEERKKAEEKFKEITNTKPFADRYFEEVSGS